MIFKGGIFMPVALCGAVVLLMCLGYMIYKTYSKDKTKMQTAPQPKSKTKINLHNFKKSIGELTDNKEFDVKLNGEHIQDMQNIYAFIHDDNEVIRGLIYDAQFCIAMMKNGQSKKSDKTSSNKINGLFDFYPGQKVDSKGFKKYLEEYVKYLNVGKPKKENEKSFLEATYYLKACSKGEFMNFLKLASLEKDLKKNDLIPKDFKYSLDYVSNQKNMFIVCILSNLYSLAIGFCNKPPEN
jgi:hypothetical protein